MSWKQKAPSSSEEGVGGGGGSRDLTHKRARQMRTNPTEPERRLWMQLRDSRLGGYKFRRQVVVGNRIVDFFCPAKGLAVEVDGDTHDHEKDSARDHAMMAEQGFATVRVTNEDVMRNLDGVLTKLRQTLDSLPDRWAGKHHPPAPSSEEEGE